MPYHLAIDPYDIKQFYNIICAMSIIGISFFANYVIINLTYSKEFIMKKIEKILLDPYQTVTYTWINTIKRRLNEISGPFYNPTTEESEFYEIFKDFTDLDWRYFYLRLTMQISRDIHINRQLVQGTKKNKHNKLNEEIELLTGKHVPNIGLNTQGFKDHSIYVDGDALLFYHSAFSSYIIPNKVNPEYMVDGNEDNYDFYTLLVSTMLVNSPDERTINSSDDFKAKFCEYYMLNNPKTDLRVLYENFNYYFNMAVDKGYIIGSSKNGGYFNVSGKKPNDMAFTEGTLSQAIDYVSYINDKEYRDARKLELKKESN